METVSGIIEHVTFHNAESGFAVLRVQVRGVADLVTVVGHAPHVSEGEYVEATGDWIQDRQHGRQFKAEQLRTQPPHTREGIERYLASRIISGIGPRTAKLIVQAFGENTLTVMDEHPEQLGQIKGIGKQRLARIQASWREQKALRHIMLFFHELGISAARAIRIYKNYGENTLEVVRRNPYQVAADVMGFGFHTADALALKLGIDRYSPERARAAVRHVLQEMSGQGHCGYPESAVVARAAELTGIDYDSVAESVELGRREEEIVREPGGEEPWLYLKPLFLSEVGVAKALHKLQEGRHPLPPLDFEEVVKLVEQRMRIRLSETQREAIRQALTSKVLVVTGGPGVGKTTLVRGLLAITRAHNLHCALCAPTGRAAKRLNETTGHEAKTIHRLLEFDPIFGDFTRNRDNPLEADFLIVDETSMVDMPLMNQLLRAVPARTCVVLVGDVDQLPSVGPGTVLADIIRSGVVPVARLTEIFRQAENSWIIRAAHQVNHGEEPASAPPGQGDFYFVEANAAELIIDRILTMVQERIPARFGFDPMRDVQILTPMNRHDLGTQALNARLQEALNPPRGQAEMRHLGCTLRQGDKVIQTVNDYQKDVFNGDIGRIASIASGSALSGAAESVGKGEVVVDFDGRFLAYGVNDLDQLALAYALTVHKSQGSEYPAVIVPLHTQHSILLQRNLLYTAITRGKRLVVLVGQRQALRRAVHRQDTSRRYSALCRRLQEMRV